MTRRGAFVLALVSAALAAVQPLWLAGQVPVLGPARDTIGAFQSPEVEVFGDVSAALIDSRGYVYILDEFSGNLRVFTQEGTFVAAAGGPGQGPGEFREELSAIIDEEDVLHVADGGNLRVSQYALDGDSLTLLGDTRVEGFPLDLCGFAGRRWILTPRVGENLVGEIRDDGVTIAEMVRRERPAADLSFVFGNTDHLFYNQSSIACDSVTGSVFFMHHEQPIIRAFGGDGVPRWRMDSISGFVQVGYRKTPSGSCCIAGLPDPETGTFSSLWAVVSDGRGNILVTMGEYAKASRRHEYELLVFDARSGRERGRLALDGVLMSVGGGVALVYVEDPFPQIRVHDLLN